MILCEHVKLLNYRHNAKYYLEGEKRIRQQRKKDAMPSVLGYSKAPKTLRKLLSISKQAIAAKLAAQVH